MTDAYDASDPRHIRQAAKQARLADIASGEIIRGLMSLAAGRQWVLELLEACHVFHSSFSTDPCAMAFAEGERNVGLRLLSGVMSSCPQQFTLMMEERNVRDLAAGTRRPRDLSGPKPEPGDPDYDPAAVTDELRALDEGTGWH